MARRASCPCTLDVGLTADLVGAVVADQVPEELWGSPLEEHLADARTLVQLQQVPHGPEELVLAQVAEAGFVAGLAVARLQCSHEAMVALGALCREVLRIFEPASSDLIFVHLVAALRADRAWRDHGRRDLHLEFLGQRQVQALTHDHPRPHTQSSHESTSKYSGQKPYYSNKILSTKKHLI